MLVLIGWVGRGFSVLLFSGRFLCIFMSISGLTHPIGRVSSTCLIATFNYYDLNMKLKSVQAEHMCWGKICFVGGKGEGRVVDLILLV